MLFIGDQSLVRRARNARIIKELEQQRDNYRNAVEQDQADIKSLQDTDSLERFAREEYLMHKDNEDVFIIKENIRH